MQKISAHRQATLLGSKEERRTVARQLGSEGRQLLDLKQNRLVEERKRDMAET